MAKEKPRDKDLFKDTTMTFGEHLEELRTCLFKALVGLVAGFGIGLYFGGDVVRIIEGPLKKALEQYHQDETLGWLEELQDAGELPAGDATRFKDLVLEDRLLAKEMYVDPDDLIRELKRVRPDLPIEKEGGPPQKESTATDGKIRKTDLVRLFLWRPIEEDIRVTNLSVQEPFMIYIKASLVFGVVLASPLIFYQIWAFVAAGLYPHEKKYIHIFLPFSLALFLAGAATAFVFVLEPVLGFLFQFNRWLDIEQDMRISEWINFVLVLPLGFGISFQLPLVMLFLERIGIFNVEIYLSKWRIAVLVIAVLAMLLTPADPYSMILMGAPLTVLYFAGILLCRFMPRSRSPFDGDLEEERKEKEKEKEEEAGVAEPPRGKRFWFILKMVIVAILLLLLFAWQPWQAARDQKAAVDRIEQLDGKVFYGYQFDESGKRIDGARPPGWSPLRRLLGGDFFDTVVEVDLSGTEADDDALQPLGGLTDLKKLNLKRTKVSKQGVEDLGEALPGCTITSGPG